MNLLSVERCTKEKKKDKKAAWFASRDGSIMRIKIDDMVCSQNLLLRPTCRWISLVGCLLYEPLKKEAQRQSQGPDAKYAKNIRGLLIVADIWVRL